MPDTVEIEHKGACIDCRHYEVKGRYNPFIDECRIAPAVIRVHGFVNLERFLTDFETQNYCIFFEHKAHEEGNRPQ